MKQKISCLFILFLILFSYSCKETIYVESTPQMLITVISKHLVPVQGATVTLYESEDDFILKETPVLSLQTDQSGQAFFMDLKEQRYFFYIEKEGLDNTSDVVATWNELQAGQRFELTIKIAEPISH